ncbi:MAG: hypothetical protein WAT33_05375, partial [Giesbergeria sp.]
IQGWLEAELETSFNGKVGLNPFEFRAGLKQHAAAQAKKDAEGLNPFEFRAGLKRPHRGNSRGYLVLIPLNSGLA